MRRVAAAVILVLAACSGGSDQAAPTPTTSTTTTTTTPATRFDASSARGDLDGDGTVDTFSIFASVADDLDVHDEARGWRMHADLAGGSAIETPARWLTWNPVVVGTTDVDGDGRAEIWVNTQDGATAFTMALVVLARDELREVEAEGQLARFLFARGGNCCPGRQPGVECVDVDGDGRTEVVAAVHDSGLDYGDGPDGLVHGPPSWSYTAWSLVGSTVREVRAENDLPSDPDIGLTFEPGLHCQGVET